MTEKKKKSQKKKRQKKKADIVVQKSGSSADVTYTGEVKKLESVTEEELVEVKQPFTDPTKTEVPEEEEPEEYEPEIEAIKTLSGNRQISAVEANYNEIKKTIGELINPLIIPTQRWYSEEFLPQDLRIKNKLRRLAGL